MIVIGHNVSILTYTNYMTLYKFPSTRRYCHWTQCKYTDIHKLHCINFPTLEGIAIGHNVSILTYTNYMTLYKFPSTRRYCHWTQCKYTDIHKLHCINFPALEGIAIGHNVSILTYTNYMTLYKFPSTRRYCHWTQCKYTDIHKLHCINFPALEGIAIGHNASILTYTNYKFPSTRRYQSTTDVLCILSVCLDTVSVSVTFIL